MKYEVYFIGAQKYIYVMEKINEGRIYLRNGIDRFLTEFRRSYKYNGRSPKFIFWILRFYAV